MTTKENAGAGTPAMTNPSEKGSHIMNNITASVKKSNVLATVTPEKDIVEVIFDPDTYNTKFHIQSCDGSISQAQSFTDEKRKREYSPLQCIDEIERGLLTLPSSPVDYGDIHELKSEIKSFINYYVDLPQDFLEICSRYVMMSWVFDAFFKIPYLRVVGFEGAGKSLFLSVMTAICYHAFDLGASITEATIFRTTDKYRGTLMIDEGNFEGTKMQSKLVQVLNKGYSRGGSIPRCNPRDYSPEYYSVFGPKIIAANSMYSDPALESRFFTCYMLHTEREIDEIPRALPEWFEWDEALLLRNKLLKYRLDNFLNIKQFNRVSIPRGLGEFEKRTQETIIPLVSCLCERDIPAELIAFMKSVEQDRSANRQLSEDGQIAMTIIKHHQLGSSSVYPKEIADELSKQDISAKQVGVFFRKMGMSASNRTNRGYPYLLDGKGIERIKKKFHLN